MYYQLPKFSIRPWNCITVKPRNRNILLFIVPILCHDILLSSQKHIVDWLICIQVPVVDGFFLVSHCIQNIPWFKSLRNNSLPHVQKVLWETSYLQHATHGFEEFSITNKMVSPLIKIVSLQECVQNTPWSLKMIAHFDIFLDISKAHRVPQDQTIYFERTTYNNQTSIDT